MKRSKCRGIKSTWKPESKSTDTLQWKWLTRYKLQVTNINTTWIKVLEYLTLTLLKYFIRTECKLKYGLSSTPKRHSSEQQETVDLQEEQPYLFSIIKIKLNTLILQ